jgi:uncharacterized repeat protein (TIGR01451 family)
MLGILLTLVCILPALSQVNNVYYTPLPEANLHSTLKTFTTAINRSIGNTVRSTISVVSTEDGAVIYYDHWEDGYEADINNPVQSTTLVWGDGNTGNGDVGAVCSTCAGDLVNAGDVMSLDNNVTLPRNPSQIRYDGRDKIGSTKFLATSQSGYATTPGPVLAGAVEVVDTSIYDLVYELPVGENTSSTDMFEHVSLFVMASQDNTTLQIDTDGNGSTDITTTINQGQSYYLKGKATASAADVLLAGATVTASKPVQAHILTGDLGGAYEARFFTLYPKALWDNVYYNPVGTTQSNDPAHAFIYNPKATAITVNYNSLSGSGSFSVPGGGNYRFVMPQSSGAHFYTASESDIFFAIMTMDSDNSNATHDWGMTLLPEGYLTNSAVVGWGPGTGDLSANGSPIWVTAIEATTVYADFDNDPTTGANTDPLGDKYDVSFMLSPYQSQTIYDNSDNDQTGTRVYTIDGTRIAVAWGQDPSTSAPGNPYLDLGTTVPPERKVVVTKDAEITLDADGDGLIDIGDEVTYSVYIFNLSLRSRETITVTDTIPGGFDYISSSTTHNSDAIPDDSPTLFPLDGGGYLLGDLLSGDRDTLVFRVTANGSALLSPSISNTVYINSNMGESWTSTKTLPVDQGSVTACTLSFTDNAQGDKTAYAENEQVCVTIDDNDANTNTGAAETLSVTVENTTTGDREILTLIETGNNTGIFTGCVSASISTGTIVEDGTLNASGSDNLSASYTDPTFGDQCNDTAIITPPTFTKQLYLSTDGSGSPDQDLDRVDPVATSDGTTATSETLNVALGGGPATDFDTPTDITNQFGGNNSQTGDLATYESSGTVTLHTVFLGKASGASKNNIYYSSKTGAGSWSTPVELSDDGFNSDVQLHPSIAVDDNNDSYVVYTHASSTDNKENIYYVTNSGGSWSTPVRISDDAFNQNASTPEIALDASGNAHVVYVHKSGTDNKLNIYYTTNSGGSWSTPVRISDDTFNQEVLLNPAIAIDGVNFAHVAFGHKSGTDSKSNLYYVTNGSGSWGTPERVSDDGWNNDVDVNPSIDTDDSNFPHVVYIHSEDGVDSKNNVYYSNRVTGSWSTPERVSDDENGQNSETPDLVISTDGIVRVAFSNNISEIYYSENSGTGNTWIPSVDINPATPTKSDSGEFPSIGFTSSQVHVVFQDKHVSLGGSVDIWHTASSFGYIVLDEFNATAFTGNDGNTNWTNNWQELGESNGASSGRVQVRTETGYTSNALRIGGDEVSITGRGVSREADLTGATSATLSFLHDRRNSGGTINLDISSNGGSTWTNLASFTSSSPTSPTIYSYDISSYIASNTQIRFLGSGNSGEPSYFFFDDVQIEYAITGSSGGVTTTSFVQTPVMCSDLILPSGSPISAVLYVNEISGNFGSNGTKEVSAILKNGASTIIDFGNGTWDNTAKTFTWAGSVPSLTTVANGESVIIQVTTAVGGVEFEIEYDSQTKPSKIDLPATTVITLDNLAVYDAAYSGGSTIGGSFNGEQVYIRATASDPFGYYDITALDINITDPNSGTTTVTAPAVDSTGCSKTFEYVWTTPGIEGNYNLEAVVKEGYEDTIADTASTVFSVSFNDLGSPCALSFTDAGGVSQDSYAADAQVCLEVNEADKNVDSGVAETVSASITSSSGDTETITLTETGVNTGIFRGCINSSSTVTGASEDGTLYAPSGDVLSGSYTDSADPGDVCTDNALINTATPDMAVSKSLVMPSDGTAQIGDFIQFDIVVSNPGPTSLTTVDLTDTYDNAVITFDSASIAPTSSGGGSITWTGLGPIASGGSLTISTYFTAAGNQNNSINSISGTGTDQNSTPVSAGPSTATVSVTQPGLSVTKTLDSPVGNAYVGDNLVYTIDLQNTGTTTLSTLPLSDFYPASCLEFVSATVTPDGSGGGTLVWDNLGSLAPAATTSITVTFTVIGACTPVINAADVSFAVDQNGDDVPSASDDASKDIQLPPTAVNDAANTTDGVGVVIDVPNNDSDPNGNLNVMSVSTSGLLQPSNGSTSINGTTGEITYTPTGGFSGTDQFEYAICDNTAPTPLCDTATVTVNVQCTGTPSQNVIEGTVFTDADQDGSLGATEGGASGITVYLYEDVNESGGIEGLDNLIDSVNTAGDGSYSFTPSPGSFPIQYLTTIDINDIPSGALMTTDNLETAYFTATGQSDCNNNFGYVADADLSLTKTANVGTVNVGQVIIFTISVSNAGPAQASGVEVTDVLPTEFTYVNDDSGGNYNSTTGVWTVGTINNGGTATINISATANAVSTPTNTAEVTMSSLNDPDSTPNNGQSAEDDQSSLQVTIDCTVIKAPMTIIKN